LFGLGFVLLCFAEDNGLDAVVRAFARSAVPLTVHRGRDRTISELYRRSFVLVRPDGHVAWRGDELPSDPEAFVGTVRGDRVRTHA
jgi:hypothetical protein